MLPGKKYKPEDFLWIAWTRKWFIILPTVVIAMSVAVWSWTLPDRYRSSTLILVVPQRVPETYVRSTVTATVAERLQTISQQILSRTRLERIIEEFNLYREERQQMIMEDIVTLMRERDINLDVARPRRNEDTSSFSVSFDAPQPRVAMQVADRLASMFVQENLQDREILADSTNQFLQAQLEDSRRRLIEHEKKLEAFRQRNAGQLPTQAQSNLQMMQLTQSQIQANIDGLTRERDRLTFLEGAIADAAAGVDQPLGVVTVERSATAAAAPLTATQQLAAARATLQQLERRWTPNHPDIARAKREIAELEAKAAEEAARQPGGQTPGIPASPSNTSAASRLTQLHQEAEQLRRSIPARQAEDQRLKGLLASYRARLEVAPQLESEMTELMRDYTTLQEQYTTLLRKSEDSKIAVNLERRQIGEQFKIIDGARMPERPFSPDRARLNLMGLGGGLGIGLLLVALLEYRDTRLKTDDDVVISLALPVLAVIPVMMTATERHKRKRRRVVLAIATSIVVVVGVAAIVAWQLQWLQRLVR